MTDVFLYRCPECSNAKLFTEDQVKDFPGGLVCGAAIEDARICLGLMEQAFLNRSIWGDPIIQLKAKL